MNLVDSILLVDDDGIANYLHEKIIRKLNIAREIFVKSNGQEAIKFIEQRYRNCKSLPSLILLDINMPVLNGLDFINELRDSELLSVKNIPVAVLTSSSAPEDVSSIEKYGYCYVNKPLTEQMVSKILAFSIKTLSLSI